MQIQLKIHASDTGTVEHWRRYAKEHLPRTNNFRSGAKHFAACHGSAVIFHADDSATIYWREEGLGTLRIRQKRHKAKDVHWLS